MAEYELIQERNISGKGVLRVPSDIQKRRHVVLYASVLRPPKSPYLNLNYSPPRSRYGFLTFLRNDYVIGFGAMEWKQQSYDTITDQTSQNLIAIKCAYEGMLQSLNNFAIALSLIPVSVVDLIKDYEYLDLAWDEVRVVCYADTAINLRLYSLPHDTCDPSKDKPKKPPVPPPPPPEQPPGTPLENLDPPYDGDDVTDPYDGDETTPPPLTPPGEACVAYRMVVRAISDQAFGEPTPGYRDFTIEGWGEFSEPYFDVAGGNALKVDFRGSLLGACQPEQITETIIVLGGYTDTSYELLSFEEIESP